MSRFATRLPNYLLFTLTWLLLAELAVPAQAQNHITSCGTVITHPGRYILENDLSCSGEGIRILSGGVDLELNAHRIQSTSHSDNGITVHDAHDTVQVRGPGEIDGFNHGVDITASNGPVFFVGVVATHSYYGYFAAGSRIGLYQCGALNGSYGFYLRVDDGEVAESTATDNPYGGYTIQGSRNLIRVNRAYGSDNGIFTTNGSVNNRIESNTALRNGHDLREGNSTCRNEWIDNTFGSSNLDCIH